MGSIQTLQKIHERINNSEKPIAVSNLTRELGISYPFIKEAIDFLFENNLIEVIKGENTTLVGKKQNVQE